MLKSLGLRFFIVGSLILLMFIPVLFVADIINARADYNRSTRLTVGAEWGGAQSISGPVMVIPVQETVMLREKHEVIDDATGLQQLDASNNPVFRHVDVQRTIQRAPVYLYPGQFDARLDSRTEERSRGIFTVPVYTARAELDFDFPVASAEDALINDEVLIWDEAEIIINMTSNRALRGDVDLRTGGRTIQIEPIAQTNMGSAGIRAPLGDPRELDGFAMTLNFNGAETLTIAPVGRTTQVTLTSDWPDPSFTGAFLPDSREITDAGFSAMWSIPHLARALPQIAREDHDHIAQQSSFGVNLYQPNDFYQKSYRAARYGILFIALTFLSIFLIEGQAKRPAHPVQYILVGLAQSSFFLLMLALAEQMGFAAAYTIAASATVLLITAFGALALQLGKRTLVLGLMLGLLYGVLYMILRSADYALLAGSMLTFGAIAATMFGTRNENWYGAPGPRGARRGWLRPGAPVSPEAPPQT